MEYCRGRYGYSARACVPTARRRRSRLKLWSKFVDDEWANRELQVSHTVRFIMLCIHRDMTWINFFCDYCCLNIWAKRRVHSPLWVVHFSLDDEVVWRESSSCRGRVL